MDEELSISRNRKRSIRKELHHIVEEIAGKHPRVTGMYALFSKPIKGIET